MRKVIFSLVVCLFCFVQFLNTAGATDGDIVVLGKTNVGDLTVQSQTDSTTAVQILDADGGTPVLNVDTTNERVGIGTAAPSYPLDVNGILNATTIYEGGAPFVSFDATAVDAVTWSDGANASNVWTFDVSGTDPTMTFGDASVAIAGSLTSTSLTTDATSAPAIAFTDSDQTDSDTTAKIYANATATGSGAEVADMSFQAMGAQGTAGTLETFAQWDGSAQSLILPLSNDAVTPTLAFGDGDTGFYEKQDDYISVAIRGVKKWEFVGTSFYATGGGGPFIKQTGINGTNPGYSFYSDENSGIGQAAADQLSLIAGGTEAMRFTESGSKVFQTVQSNVGLTADVGSAQGSGVITSSYNVYTTVGTAGDCATLPATAPVGTIVVVKNDAAANAMDVFPASGDDLGEGADTALSLAAGKGAMFLCVVADSTWTNILEGI